LRVCEMRVFGCKVVEGERDGTVLVEVAECRHDSMSMSTSCMLWWFVHFEKRMAPEVEVVVFGYVLFVTLKC
jgi:hypothetical protein